MLLREKETSIKQLPARFSNLQGLCVPQIKPHARLRWWLKLRKPENPQHSQTRQRRQAVKPAEHCDRGYVWCRYACTLADIAGFHCLECTHKLRVNNKGLVKPVKVCALQHFAMIGMRNLDKRLCPLFKAFSE